MTLSLASFTRFGVRPLGLLMLLLGTSLLAQAQTIRYVRTDGTNPNPATATTWATSTPNLQGAINASAATDQVWVATGTYKPGGNANTNRNLSFAMKNGVAIYGGFAGVSSETALSNRSTINPITGPGGASQPSSTTLSGDIGDPNTTSDNSYHVINNPTSLSLTNLAILDGFVITGGNANGSGNNGGGTNLNLGGGMLNNGRGSGGNCSPLIRNCSFQANSASSYGGAIYNNGFFLGKSSPVLTNCSFQRNSATEGGAIFNDGFQGISSPVLTNCSFQSNSAVDVGGAIANNGYEGTSSPVLTNCSFQSNSATSGGAMVNDGRTGSGRSNPTLTNCSFQGNLAINRGGAISNDAYTFGTSSPTLINCSFQNNSAAAGGAMHNDGVNSGTSSPTLTNCVVFGNGGGNTFFRKSSPPFVATYSLFEDTVAGYSGSNNLTTTVSPFISLTNARLNGCSPAINAGDNTANSTATDLDGNPRIVNGGRIDMGAYEYQAAPGITLTAPSVSTATVGEAFSQNFTTSGGTGPHSYSVVSGSLPTGLGLATTGLLSGTPTQSGSFTITAKATDATGCSEVSAPYVLTVTAPVTASLSGDAMICSGTNTDLMVTLTGTSPWTITYTDGTSPVTLSASASPFRIPIAPLSNKTYTLTAVSDPNGTGTTTGSAYVTVNTKPSLSVPTVVAVNSEAKQCRAAVTFAATATGSPAPTITYKVGQVAITSPYFFPVGTTTVTATAINSCGTDEKPFAITVSDNVAPVITASGNKTVPSEAGNCGAVVVVSASASDNCTVGTPVGTRSDGKPLTDDYPVGTTTITWKVSDANGNAASDVTQTVTVEDKVAPVARAKAITIQLNASGTASIITGDVNDGSSDNCTPATALVLALDKSSFDCSNLGAKTVTLTATDASNNSSAVAFTVTVVDKTAPVISCQAGPASQCFATNDTYAVPTLVANDNCSIASISFDITGATNRTGTGNDASGQFQPGTSTILWTVTDQSGNKSQCSTTVVVNSPLSLSVPSVSPIGAGAQPNTIYKGYGSQSLTLQAFTAGGTAPYHYLWTGGSTASSLVVTAAGVYTVTVTDAKGCQLSFTLTIKIVDVRCGNNNDKVALCNKTGSVNNPWDQICVSENAVATHLANGSLLGLCGSASGSRLGVEEERGLSITLLGNPIETNQLRVSVLGAGGQPLKVALIDMKGVVIRQQAWQQADTEQLIEWRLSAESAGLYLLRAVSNGQQQTAKVVVLK